MCVRCNFAYYCSVMSESCQYSRQILSLCRCFFSVITYSNCGRNHVAGKHIPTIYILTDTSNRVYAIIINADNFDFRIWNRLKVICAVKGKKYTETQITTLCDTYIVFMSQRLWLFVWISLNPLTLIDLIDVFWRNLFWMHAMYLKLFYLFRHLYIYTRNVMCVDCQSKCKYILLLSIDEYRNW